MLLAMTNLDWGVLVLSAFVFGVGCGVVGLAVVASLLERLEPDELLPHHQPEFVDCDFLRAASARTDERQFAPRSHVPAN